MEGPRTEEVAYCVDNWRPALCLGTGAEGVRAGLGWEGEGALDEAEPGGLTLVFTLLLQSLLKRFVW